MPHLIAVIYLLATLSVVLSAGFNRRPPPDNTLVNKIGIKPTDKCLCGSSFVYADCCDVYHKGAIPSTPEKTLRARYSAYALGVPQYIIDSSHSTSPEYLEYMLESQASLKSGVKRWSKDIIKMSNEYQYLGFEVASDPIETTTGKGDSNSKCSLKFRVLFREATGALMAVEEESTFLNEGGRWLYVDGETSDPSEEDTTRMKSEWPSRSENVLRYGAIGEEQAKTSSEIPAFQQTPKLRGEDIRASGGNGYFSSRHHFFRNMYLMTA
jgi:SEC-C motif-containing protein